MTELSDKEIIEGIRTNNRDILNYLYDDMLPMIKRLINSYGCCDQTAEDVFQEALLVIIRKINSEKIYLTCKFRTYLFSISKKIYIQQLSSSNNKLLKKGDVPDIVCEPEEDNSEFIRKYEKVLKKNFNELSEDCQKVLRLHLNDASINEIKEIMKYNSTHHTMDRKYRCKKKLIEYIQNDPQYKELKNEYKRQNRIIY